jgi:hypothetical protein
MSGIANPAISGQRSVQRHLSLEQRQATCQRRLNSDPLGFDLVGVNLTHPNPIIGCYSAFAKAALDGQFVVAALAFVCPALRFSLSR